MNEVSQQTEGTLDIPAELKREAVVKDQNGKAVQVQKAEDLGTPEVLQ